MIMGSVRKFQVNHFRKKVACQSAGDSALMIGVLLGLCAGFAGAVWDLPVCWVLLWVFLWAGWVTVMGLLKGSVDWPCAG